MGDPPGRRIAVRGALPLLEEVVRPLWTKKGKETVLSLPVLIYSTLGGLRQDLVRVVESPPSTSFYGNGGRELRVLLSMYGSRGGVGPVVGLAVQMAALGAEVRVCAPQGCAAEGRDVLVTTGVMPVGVWR